jgi:SNF2 family DNA or RNA helicase
MTTGRKLYIHQEYVFQESKDMPSAAYFLETGTGKTIVTIENIKYLWEHGLINFAFVSAPKMVVESVWEYELSKYAHLFQHRVVKWVGDISEHDINVIDFVIKKIINNKEMNMLPILLMNTEAFSHAKIYKFVLDILDRTKNIFILDESTSIKNVKSKRTKGMLRLSGLCNYKRILSGFPVLKSPEDLFSQVRFLGPNMIPYNSFYAFRNEFSMLRHMGKYSVVTGYKNLDKLSREIEPFSFRVTKKECLDLPDKVRTKRFVEMTKEQQEMYDSMKKRGYLELKDCDKKVFATSLLVQIGKLQQIANGVLIQQKLHIKNKKEDALIDIIENEIGPQQQIVVWCCFTEVLLQLEKVIKLKFGPHGCKAIYGEISHKERINILESFQNNHTRILLANPATIMHGLNLTNCSFTTYYNNSTNLEHRIQSEDRFHRIGQINKVTYFDLVVRNSVEEKILTRLENHHKIGADVLRDDWQSWFE